MTSLTYIHHDCFLLMTAQAAVVFDFWRDPLQPVSSGAPALPPFFSLIPDSLPIYVMVSHHHKDHYTRDIFTWDLLRPGISYILSRDTARAARPYITPASHYAGHKVDPSRVFIMAPGQSLTLPGISVRAYASTDIGNSWVITSAGVSALHAGDLNAWIWKDESTPAEVDAATRAFTSILADIAADWPRLDLCMFPVDSRIGRDFWTGAYLLLRAIDVARFFPMHFELADSPAQLTARHLAAADFRPYANPGRGEYIALQSPYASFSMPD